MKKKIAIVLFVLIIIFLLFVVILLNTDRLEDSILFFGCFGIGFGKNTDQAIEGPFWLWYDDSHDYEWYTYYTVPDPTMSSGKAQVKHGYYRSYWIDNTEKIKRKIIYVHGKPKGKFEYFFPDGSLMAEGKFTGREIQHLVPSYAKFYDPNGNVVSKIIDGTGIWIDYNYDGTVRQRYKNKNGKFKGRVEK